MPGISTARNDAGFRRVPQDGALLWFSAQTGTNIRVAVPETRSLQSVAPRAVLFGITNQCNMRCTFCSRDTGAASVWTVDSAFEILRDLGDRGVLEVAFGGGEPLAFPGFDTLVQRLAEETELAVHLTTNGILLSERRLTQLLPHLGEIRLSLYDDNPWEERLQLLAARGARFGANVLVTSERLAALPALLHRLEDLGCPDVALLRYVGSDRELQITDRHETMLERAVLECGLRVRLSVCFNDMLHGVPRMANGVGLDCGAGSEFVVVTSDARLKHCSFHTAGKPVTSADDVLSGWAELRSARNRAPHSGCARPLEGSPGAGEGVQVWQGFSANNSGDCVLVGRFERVEDAKTFLRDLVPGFKSGERYPDEWQELLATAQVQSTEKSFAPELMATSGRAVMLHTDMSLEDDFPELRALLWRRGGVAVYNGIHEHESIGMLAGIGFDNPQDLEAAEVDMGVADLAVPHRRGLNLFTYDHVASSYLADHLSALERVAGKHAGVLSAELVPVDPRESHLPKVLATPVKSADSYRLWTRFGDATSASAFARKLDCRHAVADRFVIVESRRLRPRYGYLAHRYGGVTTAVPGETMRITVSLWREDREQTLDAIAVKVALRLALSAPAEVHLDNQWRSAVGWIDTAAPCSALVELVGFASAQGLRLWLDAQPPQLLGAAVSRIDSDLHVLRRGRGTAG